MEDAVEVIGAIAFRDSRDHAKVQETEESMRLSCGWYSGSLDFAKVVLLRAEYRSLAAIRAV